MRYVQNHDEDPLNTPPEVRRSLKCHTRQMLHRNPP